MHIAKNIAPLMIFYEIYDPIPTLLPSHFSPPFSFNHPKSANIP